MDFKSRVSKIADWLASEHLSAALLVDVEGRRDLNVRYLTGHPGDALLFVLADGKTVLVPWDINLAQSLAQASELIPYSDFDRSLTVAVEAIVKREKLSGPIEVSATTPFPVFEELRAAAGRCEIICRREGLDNRLNESRVIKTADELEHMARAAEVTNELLLLLESYLSERQEVAEVEVALFLEREALRRGCEGMSFESLIAGPERSFGIHAFPAYSGAPFARKGLSIADFGVLVDGYPSDVTVTVTRGTMTGKQEEMLELVQGAYDLATGMAEPGMEFRQIAEAVDQYFGKQGYRMPHSLGHGLGLEVHEKPYLRNKPDNAERLEPGMVFTIEPGLYDTGAGGVRLENDLLVTNEGTRVLTNARILRFP